jgi:hypothetical protein
MYDPCEEIEAMKSTGLFLAVPCVLWIAATACAPPTEVADTPEQRLETARDLATLFVESGSYERVLEDGTDLALTSTSATVEAELGRGITDDELLAVREVLRAALAQVVTEELWETALTEITAANFTAGELQTIDEFFRSPAGIKLLERETSIQQQLDARAEAAFDDRLDSFIDTVDAGLADIFPELRDGDGE